jgi:thymidylate synthase ThyX
MQDNPGVVVDKLRAAQDAARGAYDAVVDHLEGWLADTIIKEGTPHRKRAARKQARGAARGFLGNALETRMVFSAPVWAWRHIVKMRAADAADAEIRLVMADALRELQQSRYAPQFADLVLGPASDGIGRSLVDGGHA